MDDSMIIETAGDYRVGLEIIQDSGSFNPREDYDHLTNVITPTQSRYIAIDRDGGPLQYGWDYYSVRALDCIRRTDAEDLFIRWAKIVHGATVVEDRPTDGAWAFWYLMPDKAAETTMPAEELIKADIKEYRAWADGEVYGYVVQKRITWVPKNGVDPEIEDMGDEMDTWEDVESSGGYFGRESAEEAAREAFEAYTEES